MNTQIPTTLGPRLARVLCGVLTIVSLAGCTVGPNYARPEMAIPAQFANDRTATAEAIEFEREYWRTFADPVLEGLITDAIGANHDIRIASANLREARELLIEARYEMYPIVPAQGGYAYRRQSEFESPGLSTSQRTQDIFFGGFDATWELDLFGRVRRNVEGRTADVQAFEASRRDVIVSVLAEVARNYFELRGLQARLQIARENAQNQRSTYNLTVSRLEGGTGMLC